MNNQSSRGGPVRAGDATSGAVPLVGMVTAVVAVLMVVTAAVTAVVLTVRGDDDNQAGTHSSSTTSSSGDPTDESSAPPTPGKDDVVGKGYFYSLPGGWSDVSDDANGSAAAVDSVSAWGAQFQGSRANFIVSIIPAVASSKSVEDLEDTWKNSMRKSLKAKLKDIADITVDGEEAIGIRVERTNENGVDIIQIAYLAVHGDNAYTLGLSTTPDRETDTKAAMESIIDSWSWT